MKTKNVLSAVIVTVFLVLFVLPIITTMLVGAFAQLVSTRLTARPAVDFDTSLEDLPPHVTPGIVAR
jgi:hypothetical protein